MSILIKDKALPKTCEECLFYGIDAESVCFLEKCYVIRRVGQDKPSWCPLVSVPPHGRLIDADALLSQYTGYFWTAKTDYAEGLRDVANDIKQAPTIIEAEEEQK